jgi:hypothetical protein
VRSGFARAGGNGGCRANGPEMIRTAAPGFNFGRFGRIIAPPRSLGPADIAAGRGRAGVLRLRPSSARRARRIRAGCCAQRQGRRPESTYFDGLASPWGLSHGPMVKWCASFSATHNPPIPSWAVTTKLKKLAPELANLNFDRLSRDQIRDQMNARLGGP